VVEPLLPEEPPKPKDGRPRIDDRAALTGILFVLKSGLPWEMLAQEMRCGIGHELLATPQGGDRLAEGVVGFGERPRPRGQKNRSEPDG
jgi:hypothetical protein